VEHRCSIRISSELDAVVNCRQVGVVHATIRDIGLGGMFVETGSIALRMNTPVDVTVRVAENSAHRLYRLRAWVVWSGQSGAGLMLRSFDDASYAAVRTLVSGARRLHVPAASRHADGIARNRVRKPEFDQRSRRRFA
jgi:hypothetical protein